MTLASENYRSGQPISEYIQNNLAPHFSPDLINPQHFCHSARRKPVRLSKSGLTASRAARRSTAAGLSASDLDRTARSSWPFFASAAALSRSAKLVFLELFISIYTLKGNGSWPSGRWFQIGA